MFEKTTTEDFLLNDVPHIVAKSIINATLGKSVELTCTVHNLRNYKVSEGILKLISKFFSSNKISSFLN